MITDTFLFVSVVCLILRFVLGYIELSWRDRMNDRLIAALKSSIEHKDATIAAQERTVAAQDEIIEHLENHTTETAVVNLVLNSRN
jgi:hypothetical protein